MMSINQIIKKYETTANGLEDQIIALYAKGMSTRDIESHMNAVMANLKKVYQALTIEEEEIAFNDFKKKWGKKHPIIVRSWETNWIELTAYISYPPDIRRMIYTTNIIEGYHKQLRKVTKTKKTIQRMRL